ncbi:MAG: dihydropyrimidinase, partial [Betaproteobacteria bacterium]|nr:dihydropyrimidinase [Betaproteobacteria bacterium]
MLDLVIRSDRVVTPAGVAACEVAIEGGKIAAVAAAGTFGSDTTRRLIDATGKIVMPGG